MRPRKNKLAVTIIVLSVTFLALIIYSVSRDTKGLENSAGNTLNPFQKIVYNINKNTKNFVDFFLNYSDVKDENEQLKKENNKLKDKLSKYSNLEDENENYKKILEYTEQNDNYNYVATNIIGYSGEGIIDGYIVDKGTNDGIKKNMIVISGDGLVGQVSSVSDDWAIVQCIVNENIAVSVMPESTRENSGILKGYVNSSKEKLTKIYNLPTNSQIKKGDTILTSGLGLIYPKEIRVGEVVSVEDDKVNATKTAIVKPLVDFERLEELVIVVPKNENDEIMYD